MHSDFDIFRRDRSGPEAHESGGDAPRVGPHGGTPTALNRRFTNIIGKYLELYIIIYNYI